MDQQNLIKLELHQDVESQVDFMNIMANSHNNIIKHELDHLAVESQV